MDVEQTDSTSSNQGERFLFESFLDYHQLYLVMLLSETIPVNFPNRLNLIAGELPFPIADEILSKVLASIEDAPFSNQEFARLRLRELSMEAIFQSDEIYCPMCNENERRCKLSVSLSRAVLFTVNGPRNVTHVRYDAIFVQFLLLFYFVFRNVLPLSHGLFSFFYFLFYCIVFILQEILSPPMWVFFLWVQHYWWLQSLQ
jgi:hypothetical protein